MKMDLGEKSMSSIHALIVKNVLMEFQQLRRSKQVHLLIGI